MKQPVKLFVRVLFLSEKGRWTAQCLDYDIAAQGNSLDEAMKSFEQTFVGQIFLDISEGKKPLEDFKKAPKEYWTKFDKAERLKDEKSFKIPTPLLPQLQSAKAYDRRVFA